MYSNALENIDMKNVESRESNEFGQLRREGERLRRGNQAPVKKPWGEYNYVKIIFRKIYNYKFVCIAWSSILLP